MLELDDVCKFLVDVYAADTVAQAKTSAISDINAAGVTKLTEVAEDIEELESELDGIKTKLHHIAHILEDAHLRELYKKRKKRFFSFLPF